MRRREIHPQAVVAASAKLGEGVKIGPYAVVGEDVELGDGCVMHAHAMVGGPSKFGRNNTFYSFSAIGGDPQDYTFRGERTEMVAGDVDIFLAGSKEYDPEAGESFGRRGRLLRLVMVPKLPPKLSPKLLPKLLPTGSSVAPDSTSVLWSS